jgi:hypothetical protein
MNTSIATGNFPKLADMVCLAVAETEIAKRKLNLEDLERETGLQDAHKWGSDASRRKRNSILAEFKRRVMNDVTILAKYDLKD